MVSLWCIQSLMMKWCYITYHPCFTSYHIIIIIIASHLIKSSSSLHIMLHHHNRFTSNRIIIFSSQLIKWSPPLYILSHHLSFTSYQIIIIASSLIRSSSSLHIMLHHHNRFASYQMITSALNLIISSLLHIVSHIFNITFHLSYHNHCFISSSSSLHNFSALHLTTWSSPLHILSLQLCFTSYHFSSEQTTVHYTLNLFVLFSLTGNNDMSLET